MWMRNLFTKRIKARSSSTWSKTGRPAGLRTVQLRFEPLEERTLLSAGPVDDPLDEVGQRLTIIYGEYQTFVEAGGRPDDFVSSRDRYYHFDGDRILVKIPVIGDLKGLLATLDNFEFEPTVVVAARSRVYGYLPLGELVAIAAARQTGTINAAIDEYRIPDPGSPISPGIGSDGSLYNVGVDLVDVYEEYQAFVEGGGNPAEFVSASFHFKGDRMLVEVRGHNDFQSLLSTLDTFGFEATETDAPDVRTEGYLPLGQLHTLATAEETLSVLPIRTPPKPAEPIDGVGRTLTSIYGEYQTFIEVGGRPEDFVSSRDRYYNFDGDRILVHIPAIGDLKGLLATLDNFEFEPTVVVVARNRVDGYLPLGELVAIAAARRTGMIDVVVDEYRSLPIGLPGDMEGGDLYHVGVDLAEVYEEYQAFVEGGGNPAEFVSANFDFEGDRVLVEVRGHNDFQSLLSTLDTLGFEATETDAPDVRTEGYLPLEQLHTLATAEETLSVLPIRAPKPAKPPEPPADVPLSPDEGDPTVLPTVLPPQEWQCLPVCTEMDFSTSLIHLYDEYEAFIADGGQPDDFTTSNLSLDVQGNSVKIDVRVSGNVSNYIEQSKAIGMYDIEVRMDMACVTHVWRPGLPSLPVEIRIASRIACVTHVWRPGLPFLPHNQIVTGYLPIHALDDFAALKGVWFAGPSHWLPPTSQDDQTQRSDEVHTVEGFNGMGVAIGLFSDAVRDYATAGGYGMAELYGSTGDNILYGSPAEVSLRSNGVYYNRVKFFDEVFAHVDQSGNDMADLYDSDGGGLLEADDNWAKLSSDDLVNFAIWLYDFDQVDAYSENGGTDTTDITYPLDFVLNPYGDWS